MTHLMIDATEHLDGKPGGRLSLLGGFDLRWGEALVPLPLNAQRLLAFLALQGRGVRRGYVAGTLWPDTTEHLAGASLRTAVWRVRAACRSALRADHNQLRLGPDLEVDVHDVHGWARRIIELEPVDLERPFHCLAFPGELLPDWYDDWVLAEREHLRQLRLHALEALSARLLVAGREAQAVEVGLVAVALEPLRESAQRALIRAYLAEGNGCEALRQYQAFRELLWRALELEPSARMEALVGCLDRHVRSDARPTRWPG